MWERDDGEGGVGRVSEWCRFSSLGGGVFGYGWIGDVDGIWYEFVLFWFCGFVVVVVVLFLVVLCVMRLSVFFGVFWIYCVFYFVSFWVERYLKWKRILGDDFRGIRMSVRCGIDCGVRGGELNWIELSVCVCFVKIRLSVGWLVLELELEDVVYYEMVKEGDDWCGGGGGLGGWEDWR